MIPVGIITAEGRPNYLPQCLGGLDASSLPTNIPRHIFVDGNIDVECSNGTIVHNSGAVCGSYVNHARAFIYLMETYPDAEAAIILEDDVLFRMDWYSRMVDAFESIKHRAGLGILTGYVGITQGKYQDRPGIFPAWRNITVGALCWLMVRKTLYGKEGKLFFNGLNLYQNSGYDLRIQQFMELRKYHLMVIRPGVVQHVGNISLCHPCATGKPGRIDESVNPPYAGGFHEPDFCRSNR